MPRSAAPLACRGAPGVPRDARPRHARRSARAPRRLRSPRACRGSREEAGASARRASSARARARALTYVPRSPSTVRLACGCGSVAIAAISGEPSVTECTSVVAPPTSITTRSPSACGEQLGGDQHRTRRGQDRAAHELADPLHARRVRDVLLERVVDGVTGRDDVELVHARIDVARDADAEVSRLKRGAGLIGGRRVAGVDRRSGATAGLSGAGRCRPRRRCPRPPRRRRAG